MLTLTKTKLEHPKEFQIEQTSKQRKLSAIKRGIYITIKGSILQEHITILTVYVPCNRASKHGRKKK